MYLTQCVSHATIMCNCIHGINRFKVSRWLRSPLLVSRTGVRHSASFPVLVLGLWAGTCMGLCQPGESWFSHHMLCSPSPQWRSLCLLEQWWCLPLALGFWWLPVLLGRGLWGEVSPWPGIPLFLSWPADRTYEWTEMKALFRQSTTHSSTCHTHTRPTDYWTFPLHVSVFWIHLPQYIAVTCGTIINTIIANYISFC